MRLVASGLAIAVLALLIGLNWTHVFEVVVALQRQFQNAMASALRAAQAGNLFAVFTLCAVTFVYGYVHALGPGHGKIVLGGAAVGGNYSARRIIRLSFASAMAQSGTAILFVGGAVIASQTLSGRDAVDLADGFLSSFSYGLIALVGLVLCVRGLRALFATSQTDSSASCSHKHGPSPSDVEAVQSWKDTFVLIASIAVRPCSGALLLLVIAAGLNLLWFGVLGTISMGIGTALLNATVGTSGALVRNALKAFNTSAAFEFGAVLQLLAGMLILALSVGRIL